MLPVLFKIGSFTLHTYGVLLAFGVLAGLTLAQRRAPRIGLDSERVWSTGVYGVLAALVVAKLWLLAADFSYYRANPAAIFSLSTLQSGGVFYGGFVGGVATILYHARRYRMPVLKLLDVFSPSLMIGSVLGRLGCFCAGCCWGSETHLAWAVTFTNPYAKEIVGTPLGVPLHPAQLYNLLAAAAILFCLLWLERRQRFTGQIFAAMTIGYGVTRFLTEFYRGDPGRELGFTNALSQAQLVCIVLVVVGAVLWMRGRGATAAAMPAAAEAAASRARRA